MIIQNFGPNYDWYNLHGGGRTYAEEISDLNEEIAELQKIVHFLILFKQPVPKEYEDVLKLYEKRNYAVDHKDGRLPHHSYIPNYNPKHVSEMHYLH